MRIWEIPESSRRAKGTALVNFLSIGQDEKVQAFLTMTTDELEGEKGFVFFGTRKGTVKKTPLDQFENIRTSGIMAINLADGDSLVGVQRTSGKEEVMLVTANGQSIRFAEKDARAMGRSARGVTGIKFSKKEDYVVGMVVVPIKHDELDLIVVTEKGYGKKTSLREYKQQKRGGSGILTYKVGAKTGKVISARVQNRKEAMDVLIAAASGTVIRLSTKQIPQLGRATMGVRLIKLSGSDKATSVAFL